MPTVPKYQQQTELRGLANVQQQSIASPELLGTGARQLQESGNTMLRAGAGLGQAAANMQQREDADMVFQAEAAFRESLIGFEQEAMTRTGNKAWGITKDVDKWFQDSGAKFAEGLTNDRQRAIFGQTVSKMRLQGLDQFSRFESQQRVKSLEQSTNATLETLVNSAANTAQMMNGADFVATGPRVDVNGQPVPGAISALQSMKQDGLRRLDFFAADTGEDSSVTDLKKQQYLSKFHKQVIQARIEADPASARAYFEANKEEIHGAERMALDKLVRTGDMKLKAQQFADKVLDDGIAEGEAIKQARQKFQGQDEDLVVTEVKTRFGELNQAREADQRKAADQAFDIYARTGRLSSIPADVLNRMDGKTLIALRRDAKAAAEGVAIKTDDNLYYALYQEAKNSPESFAKRDLRQVFDRLSSEDRQEMIKLQAKVQQPDQLKDLRTYDQQLTLRYRELGWDNNDSKQKAQFEKAANQAVTSEESARGRQLTYDEREKVLDRLMIRNGRKRFFQVQGTDKEEDFTSGLDDTAKRSVFLAKIPPSERLLIEKALKADGQKVTDQAILNLYVQVNR